MTAAKDRPPISGTTLVARGANPRNLEWFAAHEVLSRLRALGARTTEESVHTIWILTMQGDGGTRSLLAALESAQALSDEELLQGLATVRARSRNEPRTDVEQRPGE